MPRKYLLIFILSTALRCAISQNGDTSGPALQFTDPGKDPGESIANSTVNITTPRATSEISTLPPTSTANSPSTEASVNSTDPNPLREAASNSDALKPEGDSLASTSTLSTVASSPVTRSIPDNPVKSSRPPYRHPETCAERALQPIQPEQDELSMIRKCCAIGESFANENFTDRPNECVDNDAPFLLEPIAVTMYNGCIEDNETRVEMDISVGNFCNRSVYYSESLNDRMYIIQNGSLLVMDPEGTVGFRIFNDYCIDINAKTGKYDAIVCVSPPVEAKIGRSQSIIYTIFMMISIPCLFFVTFIHFAIDKLNHLHGLCIGSMSFCLGMGFLLHSITQLSTLVELRLQYAVQYFILAYYMWIFILCLNLVLFLWIYVLHYVNLRTRHKTAHFVAYFMVAMVLPIFLVIYTKIKRIPGMPSYFQQAWNESIKMGQRYFIPPVSTILAICFVLLVLAYFGFRKLDELLTARDNVSLHLAENGATRLEPTLPKIDRSFAEQVQLNARCLALLYVIVVFTWILEVVTFYSPGAGDILGFLEAMNAMQGVFILIIFVIIRKKRTVIASWWHDRGSHNISDGTEMQPMKGRCNEDKEQDEK